MIRHLLRTALLRLTTDSAALRARVVELEGERDRYKVELTGLLLGVGHPAWLPSVADAIGLDDIEADASAVLAAVRKMAADRDRLRALAGNTGPTAGEALMLGIVRETPGLMALEYGEAHAKASAAADLAETPTSGWAKRVVEEGPDHWFIRRSASVLTGLHRKGFVRRDPAGQSFRYWPVSE